MSTELLALAKYVAVMGLLLGLVAPLMAWVERRGMALIQDRRGPNRVGPLGLLQSLADGLKFIFKEDIVPASADRLMYLLGPVLALVPALTTFVVIPFAPSVEIGGRLVDMVVVPGEAGVLVFLAMASLGVYALVTAGYGSNNKFSLMGSVRAAAQLISYELALGLAILAVLLPVGSFELANVIEYQRAHLWNAILQLPGFFVFVVAMFAETNRLPFDLPEAESELVAGYATEYGSMKFALFFMGEYANMAVLSGLMATLYLGGWSLPGWTPEPTWASVLLGFGILATKIALMMCVFVWVRFSFPRFRYDQLMRLGWKFLLPLALLNLLVVSGLVVWGVY